MPPSIYNCPLIFSGGNIAGIAEEAKSIFLLSLMNNYLI